MKKLRLIIGGIFISAAFTLCLLSFGSPQLGKWVYMWQAYVYPDYNGKRKPSDVNLNGDKFDDYRVPIPNKFSGTWCVWNEEGVFVESTDYLNGFRHGLLLEYSGHDGSLQVVRTMQPVKFLGDDNVGLFRRYHNSNVRQESLSEVDEFESNDLVFERVFDKNGEVELINFFEPNEIPIIIFSKEEGVDKRKEYEKEIKEFENKIAEFEKEFGIEPPQ